MVSPMLGMVIGKESTMQVFAKDPLGQRVIPKVVSTSFKNIHLLKPPKTDPVPEGSRQNSTPSPLGTPDEFRQ